MQKAAKIASITFYERDNYVNYDDTDIQTDYFDSYTIGTEQMIEWTKEDGGHVIRVDFINDQELPKFHKRLKRLCQECGYVAERRDQEHVQLDGRVWKSFDFILKKTP